MTDTPRPQRLRTNSARMVTVQELLAWCWQRNVDPAEVTVTSADLTWSSPETDDEAAAAAAAAQRVAEQLQAWERATLARLQAKYPDGPEADPDAGASA